MSPVRESLVPSRLYLRGHSLACVAAETHTSGRPSDRATTRVRNRRLVCSMVVRNHAASACEARWSRICRTRSGIICNETSSPLARSVEARYNSLRSLRKDSRPPILHSRR